MAKVIVAPNDISTDDYSIFLAGAIDMGAAVDWQAQVIKELANQNGLTLVNPRRENFTPDTLDEQIAWELDALERVDVILMWFPKNAKAPISFFEAGLYMRSGKLFIGAEPGFYRRRNLELTCERYGVRLYDDLAEMVSRLPYMADLMQETPAE